MKDEIIIEDFVDSGVIELEEKMHMPVLENLTIVPSEKQQVFKSKKDGFNEVVVEGVEGDELTIIPTTEEQINEGLFDKIIVKKVTSDIDKNIRPEIIREGEKILDVIGNYKGIDTSDATATPDNILKDKTAYVNGQKIDGIIEDYDGSYTGNASFTSEWESIFLSSIDDSLGANVTKLPEGITSIGDYAFYHRDNLALTELTEEIIEIGKYAFYYDTNLALTKLPQGIKSIGEYAFNGCTKLAISEIPSGVNIINRYTFVGCLMPSLFLLAESITINNYAFRNCLSLKAFVMPNIVEIPVLISSNAFNNTPIEKSTGYIYVPDSFVEQMKIATNWSTYADQIKPISEMEV